MDFGVAHIYMRRIGMYVSAFLPYLTSNNNNSNNNNSNSNNDSSDNNGSNKYDKCCYLM